ncbi:DNA repair protein RadA [Candidatus Dojkabacteria bacterium]|nr:DNA repair protein RadA [Candidatus Dojkabacteria bacterium]
MQKSSEKTVYICRSCGYQSTKWSGKCLGCGEWDTLEENVTVDAAESKKVNPAKVVDFSRPSKNEKKGRFTLGMKEVERVLGGGVVSGEVVLVSGEPGIGKSTLLMQVFQNVSNKNEVMYVSGEESLGQISSRFERLSLSGQSKDPGLKNLKFTEETNVDSVISAIEQMKPAMVAVDSIQSMFTEDVRSFAGSVSQVRECGMRLTRCAKRLRIPIFIVGQVTKEGVVAGPKVLEHVVDAVLYFEGDDFGMYRILRALKNRFGTTDEVGIFEMTTKGLKEVDDPTSVFCESGKKRSPGVVVSAIFKGSRVIFVEVQALTSGAAFGSPRRMPNGFGKSRLEMLCAVLGRRAGVNLFDDDVFVNIMGGVRVDDPSLDLAICMAVVSAKKDKPIPAGCVFVGEVGLSGRVREVPFQGKMEAEAKRRGLKVIGGSKSDKDLYDLIRSVLK